MSKELKSELEVLLKGTDVGRLADEPEVLVIPTRKLRPEPHQFFRRLISLSAVAMANSVIC